MSTFTQETPVIASKVPAEEVLVEEVPIYEGPANIMVNGVFNYIENLAAQRQEHFNRLQEICSSIEEAIGGELKFVRESLGPFARECGVSYNSEFNNPDFGPSTTDKIYFELNNPDNKWTMQYFQNQAWRLKNSYYVGKPENIRTIDNYRIVYKLNGIPCINVHIYHYKEDGYAKIRLHFKLYDIE